MSANSGGCQPTPSPQVKQVSYFYMKKDAECLELHNDMYFGKMLSYLIVIFGYSESRTK